MSYEIQANDTLITPQEAVKFAPVDVHSHGEARLNFIVDVEENLFQKCFGYDFYLALLENKKVYVLTDDFTHFQENTNYAIGDYVMFKDELFKVIKATTGKEKPPLRTHFEEAEKFNNEQFELLWKRYLRRIIAFAVNSESLMFRSAKDTADGLVRKNDGDYKGISIKEVATIRKDYNDKLSTMIDNAKQYILKYPTDFETCTFIKETCNNGQCDNTARKRRHHGFNTNKR